jgi:hypothetical protein
MHRPGAFVASIVSDDELCHFLNRHGPGEPPVVAIAHRQLEVFTAEQPVVVVANLAAALARPGPPRE